VTLFPEEKGFVYLIHDTEMTHFYIGSTNSVYRRFKHHKSSLKRGKHHCIPLQRSWDKYGADAFKFTVILQDVTRSEASQKEHDLLSIFYRKAGCLNISSNGIMSAQCPDVIKKRNETLKSQEHRASASIKTKAWREANPEAAKMSDQKLSQVGKSEAARKANSERSKLINSTDEAKNTFKKRMATIHEKNKKPVLSRSTDGKVTFYPSIVEASRIVGIHVNAISNCCLGRARTSAGMEWEYVRGGKNAA
jgi:group I intron endonuclease